MVAPTTAPVKAVGPYEYARDGFRVLPILSDGTKRPAVGGFGKDTPDFTIPPENFGPADGVAILTGPCPAFGADGDWLAVIDLDGDTKVAEINDHVGVALPPTLSSKGYRHLYYRVEPGPERESLRQWVRIFGRGDVPEVDLKWAGGYAIEPPNSWDGSGWDPARIAPLPVEWIRAVLRLRNAPGPQAHRAAVADDAAAKRVPLENDEKFAALVVKLAEVWPLEACRHEAALALGGILGDSWWDEDAIATFCGELYARTGTKNRTSDVLTSVATRRAGGECKGWPTLKACLKDAGRGDYVAALKALKMCVPGLSAPKVTLPELTGEGKRPTKAGLVLSIGSANEVALDILAKELTGVVFDEGKFWRCSENVWSEIPRFELSRLVSAYDGVVYDYTDKGKPIWLKISAGFVSSAIDLLGSHLNRPAFFRNAKVGALFACGTFVGLEGAEPATPDHRCRARLAVPWGKASVQRTLVAMRQWFEGCTDASQRVAVLFEHLGLSIVGGWAASNNPGGTILLGEGANGKSVWLEVVRGLMPHGTVSAIPPQEFAREYCRAGLVGSRINICTEIPERQILASGHMKAIFSYETVSGRLPYGQPFEFTPQCGHIFSCNALPATEDQSAGFWRRWKVIRFPNRFEGARANPYLARELVDHEAQGIIFYAVDAALAAVRRGALTVPDSSLGELESWRTSTDQVAEFALECLVTAQGLPKKDWVGLNILYQTYKAWCAAAGHERPMKRSRFKDRLAGLQFMWDKTEKADVAFAVKMHGGVIMPPTLTVLKGGKQ